MSAIFSWETTSQSAPILSRPWVLVSIAQIIRPGHIKSSKSRNLPDFSVTEVLIDLADPGPLVEGIKVDGYFQAGSDAQ